MRLTAKILAAVALVAFAQPAAQSATQSPAQYAVVHGWPVLPEGGILGQATGVGVDSGGTRSLDGPRSEE